VIGFIVEEEGEEEEEFEVELQQESAKQR